MAAKKKRRGPKPGTKSPLKGTHHVKKEGWVKRHKRWVAGKVGNGVVHKVCVEVPNGFDLKLVRKGGTVGKRRKRRSK